MQRALPFQRSQPRWADADIAVLSPAWKRSKGESPLTTVRSKVAIAATTSSIVGSRPKTLRKASWYSGTARITFTTASWLSMPISTALIIGPLACSSRLAARPSQNWNS